MKVVLFCHAFTSCWNNGHAHFLRGLTRELIRLGHRVLVCEPERGWSRINAIADGGETALAEAERVVPSVELTRYGPGEMEAGPALDLALDQADLVLVHEWNEPALVAAIGRSRQHATFRLFFMDAHHRAVTASAEIDALQLDRYDGVLAFGEALREVYRRRGWGRRAYTWHEAADCALFRPHRMEKNCDLIWVGNWGDDERSRELREFLIAPSALQRLHSRIHGVRYPDHAKRLLQEAGILYAGWLPNHRVPEAFAGARVTVHIPRQIYGAALAGIPTIRVFEALACGIPLICSPWSDEERLFPAGCYLQANNTEEMAAALQRVLEDRDLAGEMVAKGGEAIRRSHTCRHRVEQLLAIVAAQSGSERQALNRGRQLTVGAAP
jgi:spore maturation protein CgeB